MIYMIAAVDLYIFAFIRESYGNITGMLWECYGSATGVLFRWPSGRARANLREKKKKIAGHLQSK